eukprot:2262282-Pleurochrysis_carterae.AAC.2
MCNGPLRSSDCVSSAPLLPRACALLRARESPSCVRVSSPSYTRLGGRPACVSERTSRTCARPPARACDRG